MGAMVPLQQSPAFARALTAFGADVTQTTPVILYRRIAPVGHIAFASRATPDAIAQTPVRIVNGETPCPRPYRAAGFRQIITAAHIAEWDLTQHDLRASLSGKWRNRLKQAEKSGLRLRIVDWGGTPHPLFGQAETLARKRRFKTYPTALLTAYASLNPRDALIFEAFDRGTLVAACLVLRHGATATYQTAWSSATGHALQAPRLLLFQAACHLQTLGHDIFDLGTLDTENAKGLARFKLGTGAQVRPLGGTWIRWRGR